MRHKKLMMSALLLLAMGGTLAASSALAETPATRRGCNASCPFGSCSASGIGCVCQCDQYQQTPLCACWLLF